MPDILDQFIRDHVEEFKHDFFLILKMANDMDVDFGRADPKFYRNKPCFEKSTRMFSKKYQTILVEPLFDDSDKFFRIFFKETSLKKMFIEALSKIQGLRSVGSSGLDQISITDSERLKFFLEKTKKKMYIRYYTGSIILEQCRDRGMIELIYDVDTIQQYNKPEFKLCAFYAIRGHYDHSIDLDKVAAPFCFTSSGNIRNYEGLGGPRR